MNVKRDKRNYQKSTWKHKIEHEKQHTKNKNTFMLKILKERMTKDTFGGTWYKGSSFRPPKGTSSAQAY